jgi:hypothetical protein
VLGATMSATHAPTVLALGGTEATMLPNLGYVDIVTRCGPNRCKNAIV